LFNKAIHSTMLTSDVADRLFSNIIAVNAPDQSFLTTLRAMLHRRLSQNETVQITCTKVRRSVQEFSYGTTADCFSWILPDALRHSNSLEHGIHIVHTAGPEAGEKMLEIVRANAGIRYLSNFTRRDDLQVFYARKVKALFYTDDAEKNTVIFAEKLELKHFHALQMMIPKYLPQLFTDSPLTETEINLLKSTGNRSADEYERLIEDFARELDIRAEIIRSKLAGFETGFERVKADELRNEIAICQNEYALHFENIIASDVQMVYCVR